MPRKMFKSIDDVPAKMRRAYAAGKYHFRPPDVIAKWGELEWINYVIFSPEIENLRQTDDQDARESPGCG